LQCYYVVGDLAGETIATCDPSGDEVKVNLYVACVVLQVCDSNENM